MLFAVKLKQAGVSLPLVVIYGLALCAMAAKAVSMLFVSGVNLLYAAFAALGGTLLALSDLIWAHAHFYPAEQKTAGVLSIIIRYAAQALLALSIAL